MNMCNYNKSKTKTPRSKPLHTRKTMKVIAFFKGFRTNGETGYLRNSINGRKILAVVLIRLLNYRFGLILYLLMRFNNIFKTRIAGDSTEEIVP